MVAANAPLDPLITLTVADLAAVIGCSQKHVYSIMESGHLPPPIRIGRLVRWDRATIEEWLKAGAPPVGRPAPKEVAR